MPRKQMIQQLLPMMILYCIPQSHHFLDVGHICCFVHDGNDGDCISYGEDVGDDDVIGNGDDLDPYESLNDETQL